MTTLQSTSQIGLGLQPIIDVESSTVNSNYTLPTGSNIKAGQRVRVINTSTTTGIVSVLASDTTVAGYVYPSTDREFLALQDNPTTLTHWSQQARFKAPTTTILTSPIYLFSGFASSTVVAGSTYTVSGNVYQAIESITSGTSIHMINISGGNPPASGTLTSMPVGSYTNLTYTSFVQTSGASSGTYTPPAGCTWFKLRMVGGGGGGGGAGTLGTYGNGQAGQSTTFGGNTCTGGNGNSNSNAVLGGYATLGSGAVGLAIPGQGGPPAGNYTSPSAGAHETGGSGGSSPFGGAGNGFVSSPGTTAIGGTGSGGGGGAETGGAANVFLGGGGAAGGYIDATISNPAASYAYTIGYGGAGGTAGTSGTAGAYGANGSIIIEEHYSG